MRRFLVRFVTLLVGFGLLLLLVPEIQEPAQVAFARLLVTSLTALGWSGVHRWDVLVDFPGGHFAIGALVSAARGEARAAKRSRSAA